MRNTQSTKNGRTPNFFQQLVERDNLGASLATMVKKSGPTGAITY